MRGGLIGDDVRPHVAPNQLRQHLGRIAEQSDRDRLVLANCLLDARQRIVEIARLHREIARAQTHVDAGLLTLDRETAGACHHGRERLRPTHAAEPRREDPAARQGPAIVLTPHLDEGFVRALHDALTADVDPRSGGHLAVHHQALAVEIVERVPIRPVRYEVRVREQHPRCIRMRRKHTDGLAGLNQQGLIVLQTGQRRDDPVVTLPVAGRATDATIDHELRRLFGHGGIEIVHQHAKRRLGQPAACRQRGTRGGTDMASGVNASHAEVLDGMAAN